MLATRLYGAHSLFFKFIVSIILIFWAEVKRHLRLFEKKFGPRQPSGLRGPSTERPKQPFIQRDLFPVWNLCEAQRGQHPNRRDAKKPKKAKKGKPPKYTRLDKAKRGTIATLHRMGVGDAEIARQIGCHRSTIKREIEQNKSQKGYRPKKAQEKAEGRIKAKATARRKFTPAQWKEAKERLEKDGWTFEQTSERARRDGRRFVCKETLYKEYYARQRLVARGKSQEILPVLPRGHRKRHKRGKSYAGAGRGRIPGRIDIDLRPKSVENRARAGHWEGDLINGLRGTGNLVTVVERMSRFTLVGYSATKETDAVMAVFKALLRDLPREMVQSLTLDNGKEYAKFKVLVRDRGLAASRRP